MNAQQEETIAIRQQLASTQLEVMHVNVWKAGLEMECNVKVFVEKSKPAHIIARLQSGQVLRNLILDFISNFTYCL